MSIMSKEDATRNPSKFLRKAGSYITPGKESDAEKAQNGRIGTNWQCGHCTSEFSGEKQAAPPLESPVIPLLVDSLQGGHVHLHEFSGHPLQTILAEDASGHLRHGLQPHRRDRLQALLAGPVLPLP